MDEEFFVVWRDADISKHRHIDISNITERERDEMQKKNRGPQK